MPVLNRQACLALLLLILSCIITNLFCKYELKFEPTGGVCESAPPIFSDINILDVVNELQSSNDKYDDILASKYYNSLFKTSKFNDSMLGWVSIPALGIDYPVMYSDSDNQWYLKHDTLGTESKHGSISMDIQNHGEWGTHVLLNGHNMKDDTMFGRLPDLLDKEVFDTVQFIDIFDGSRKRVYKIFSVFTLNDTEESITVSFNSLEGYQIRLKDYQARSLYYREIPSNATEALILNTCWYGVTGEERDLHCIVVAYRFL